MTGRNMKTFTDFMVVFKKHPNKIAFSTKHAALLKRVGNIDNLLEVMGFLDQSEKSQLLITLGVDFFAKLADCPEALYTLMHPLEPDFRGKVLITLGEEAYEHLEDEHGIAMLNKLIPLEYLKRLNLPHPAILKCLVDFLAEDLPRDAKKRLEYLEQQKPFLKQHSKRFSDLRHVLNLVSKEHKIPLLFALGKKIINQSVKSGLDLVSVFSLVQSQHVAPLFALLTHRIGKQMKRYDFLSKMQNALTPAVYQEFHALFADLANDSADRVYNSREGKNASKNSPPKPYPLLNNENRLREVMAHIKYCKTTKKPWNMFAYLQSIPTTDYKIVLDGLSIGVLKLQLNNGEKLKRVFDMLPEQARYAFLKSFSVKLVHNELARYQDQPKMFGLIQHYRQSLEAMRSPVVKRFFPALPSISEAISDEEVAQSAFFLARLSGL